MLYQSFLLFLDKTWEVTFKVTTVGGSLLLRGHYFQDLLTTIKLNFYLYFNLEGHYFRGSLRLKLCGIICTSIFNKIE